MDEASGLTSCTSGLASESQLSCSPEAQPGFILKLIHHIGQNSENREQSQAFFDYAMARKGRMKSNHVLRKWFFLFFLL